MEDCKLWPPCVQTEIAAELAFTAAAIADLPAVERHMMHMTKNRNPHVDTLRTCVSTQYCTWSQTRTVGTLGRRNSAFFLAAVRKTASLEKLKPKYHWICNHYKTV